METRQNRAAFWFVAILVGVPLLFLVAFYVQQAYSRRDTTSRGPLTAVADWPEPIQDLHAALEASGTDTSSFSVYLLYGQPEQVLSTVVCRVRVDDASWDTIATKLDLQQIPNSDGIDLHAAIVPLSDTSWWPATNSPSDYFASRRLLAGDEADLYQVARNNQTNVVYIYYQFNF
jgi:hypothetical protein